MSSLLTRVRLAGGVVTRFEGKVSIRWPNGGDEDLASLAASSKPLIGALLDVEESFLPDAAGCYPLAVALAICARCPMPQTETLAGAIRAACKPNADVDLPELRRLGQAAVHALKGLPWPPDPDPEDQGGPLFALVESLFPDAETPGELDRYYGKSPVRRILSEPESTAPKEAFAR